MVGFIFSDAEHSGSAINVSSVRALISVSLVINFLRSDLPLLQEQLNGGNLIKTKTKHNQF
jgi:hypothetical protein